MLAIFVKTILQNNVMIKQLLLTWISEFITKKLYNIDWVYIPYWKEYKDITVIKNNFTDVTI